MLEQPVLDSAWRARDGESHPATGSKSPSSDGAQDFFTRNGFDCGMQHRCDSFAHSRYPDAEVAPAKTQGYCSYTLTVSTTHLLQFRPDSYRLNTRICDEARLIYQNLVPKTEYLGYIAQDAPGGEDGGKEDALLLHVYLQEKVPGITLAGLQQQSRDAGDETRRVFRRRLVQDLARVFALGFHHGRPGKDATGALTFEKGKVGRSLRWRLDLLRHLQGEVQQQAVAEVARGIEAVENSLWCLTHGDLVPANIMVDPESGHLTGLVDWAEGEWLPFGVGLYGLEEVLGSEDPAMGFLYCDDHAELREAFWDEFFDLASYTAEIHQSSLDTVGLSRKFGILLWRGIAFEDGRIDRVVEAGKDDSELHKLRQFLGVADHHMDRICKQRHRRRLGLSSLGLVRVQRVVRLTVESLRWAGVM